MDLDTDEIKEKFGGYTESLEDVYIGRLIFIAIIALIAVYSSYVLLLAPDVAKPTDEQQFEITYSSDQITVEQTEGNILQDNMNLEVRYSDGFTQNTPISLAEDNPTDNIKPAFDISDAEKSIVYWENNDERINITSKQVPSEYKIDDPQLSVPSMEVEAGETLDITSEDYALSTESSISEYQWDLGTGQSFSGPTLQHTFSEEGTYSSELTVTDSFGNTATDTFVVTVKNTEIISSVDIPSDISVGQQGTFSYDTDKDIFSQLWNIDGSTYTTPTVTHAFDSPGVKDITLTVKTEDGREEQFEDSITLGDSDFEIQVEDAGSEGVRFNLSESEGSDFFDYQWEFGDSNFDVTTEPETVHKYESDGEYEVQVVATNTAGETTTRSKTVSIPYESEDDEQSEEEDDQNNNQTEEDESYDADIENADVRITVSTSGQKAWTIDSIEGENPGNILQEDTINSRNPSLYLEKGVRYEIDGIPKGEPENGFDYFDFEIRGVLGEPILSQSTEGKLEGEDSINWYDSENTVRFNVTEPLIEEMDGYQSSRYSTKMDGDIEVVEDY